MKQLQIRGNNAFSRGIDGAGARETSCLQEKYSTPEAGVSGKRVWALHRETVSALLPLGNAGYSESINF